MSTWCQITIFFSVLSLSAANPQSALTVGSELSNLPPATSTNGVLPPFSSLGNELVDGYGTELFHRMERFLNRDIEWQRVRMASSSRGGMHPEGLYLMDGHLNRRESVHGLWLRLREVIDPGTFVTERVNTTVVDDHTLRMAFCVSFSLAESVTVRRLRELTLCGVERHFFDDDGWLIEADHFIHSLYSMTSTLLPQDAEPSSTDGFGFRLILPTNPIALLSVFFFLLSTSLGFCIVLAMVMGRRQRRGSPPNSNVLRFDYVSNPRRLQTFSALNRLRVIPLTHSVRSRGNHHLVSM